MEEPREKCLQSRGRECLTIVPGQFEGAEHDRGCDFFFYRGMWPVRAIKVFAPNRVSEKFIFAPKVVL